MANYSFIFKDDELSHHGIEGQKWGVRNGPPYPLDSGDHSAAERRAMRKDSKQIYKRIKSRTGYSSYIPSDKRKEKLEEYYKKYPEIAECKKAWEDALEFPKSKEVKNYLADCAKRDYEKYKNDSYYGNLQRLTEEYQNEGDVYLYLLSNPYSELKEKYSSLFKEYDRVWENYDDSLDKAKPIYDKCAKELLGKYADKSVEGMLGNKQYTASEILADALKFYYHGYPY